MYVCVCVLFCTPGLSVLKNSKFDTRLQRAYLVLFFQGPLTIAFAAKENGVTLGQSPTR